MTEARAPFTLPDPSGFSQLNKLDQVRYVQQLWDRIAAVPESLDVPASHLALIEKRLADHQSNPQDTIPARDVLHRLTAKPEK